MFFNRSRYIFLSCVFTSLLTACGGGSSGDGSNDGAASGDQEASPVSETMPTPEATPVPTPTTTPTITPTATPTATPPPIAPAPVVTDPSVQRISFVEFENIPRCVEQIDPNTPVDPSVIICSTPDPDSFTIIERNPFEFSNRMHVRESIDFTFGQQVTQSNAELNNFITLAETDTGVMIPGVASHTSNNGISFTPDSSLSFSTKYTITVAPGLTNSLGESFPGESWQFATLFDVGATTRETLNRCGLTNDLLYLGYINDIRSLSAGSACASLGFTEAQLPLSFSCSLRSASALSAFRKIQTLVPDGSFSAVVDYQNALTQFSYNASEFDTVSAVGVNSLASIDELFANGFSSDQCEVIMNAGFTEFGGAGGETNRVPQSSFFFYEMIFAIPAPVSTP